MANDCKWKGERLSAQPPTVDETVHAVTTAAIEGTKSTCRMTLAFSQILLLTVGLIKGLLPPRLISNRYPSVARYVLRFPLRRIAWCHARRVRTPSSSAEEGWAGCLLVPIVAPGDCVCRCVL